MATNKRDLTISGLERCGWVKDIPPGRKYLAFRKHGDPRTYYVGNSGALRMSRYGKVTGSLSLTGTAAHRAYQEVGNPHYRFDTVEQAMEVLNVVMRPEVVTQ